jgi:hypothetical protein
MLMTDRLQKSNRTNLTDTRNATFSQALEAGLTHYDYLDGRKTGRYLRAAALVSHSVSPAKAKELKTSDTFGPLFDGLSPKNDLQQSLENKLRQAMAVNGCQEYVLTWKRWDMKSGPPICALRASGAPHIRQRLFWVADSKQQGLEGHAGDGDRRNQSGRQQTTRLDSTAKGGAQVSGKTPSPSPAPMESGEGCLAGWTTPRSHTGGMEEDPEKATGKNDTAEKSREESGMRKQVAPKP